MRVVVSIGCYKMPQFIELAILRYRRLLPEVPILLSDDKSSESQTIQSLADRYECDYVCSPSRRGHFANDMQGIINGIVFGRELAADIVIKSSQRFIPILPPFFGAMFRAFQNPKCQVVLPGQLDARQIARPAARFYRKFGVLSDIIALRPTAIEPTELLAIYRERAGVESVGKRPVSDSFTETTIGYLLDRKFPGEKHCVLPEWTNHQFGAPKLFLRKSQSPSSEYAQVAVMEGLMDKEWDIREWLLVETQHGYKPKADLV